jgi:hypothetical protein
MKYRTKLYLVLNDCDWTQDFQKISKNFQLNEKYICLMIWKNNISRVSE